MKKAIVLLLFLCGSCVWVNTQREYDAVQSGVFTRSGYCSSACVEELLQQELTPDLAVKIALVNNPKMREFYAEVGVAKADLVQASLLKNPVFAFLYRFSQSALVTDLIDIALLQNILETALIPMKKKRAAAELDAICYSATAQILDLIAEVKGAFYSYQAAELIFYQKKDLLLAAESAFDAANRLFAAGNLRELDVVEKRGMFEQAKIAVADQEMALLLARERLNVLMGLWGEQTLWVGSICLPEIEKEEPEWNQVERWALCNSLDLRMLRKKMCATAAEMGIDTTRLVIPEFNFGAAAERDDSVWFVGPALSVALPFFDWGQAKQAAARSEICRQWSRYTSFAIQLRATARAMRLEVLNSHRKSRYLHEVIVPLAEERTTLTLHQHNAMQMGVFTLLETKQREIEQKIDVIVATRDYWLAKTDLELLLQGHMRE